MKAMTDSQVNDWLSRLCGLHGFARIEFGEGRIGTVGLRGPQGHLICDLMSALRHLAVRGKLPTFTKAEKPKAKRGVK
jgi:hypothetical protein